MRKDNSRRFNESKPERLSSLRDGRSVSQEIKEMQIRAARYHFHLWDWQNAERWITPGMVRYGVVGTGISCSVQVGDDGCSHARAQILCSSNATPGDASRRHRHMSRKGPQVRISWQRYWWGAPWEKMRWAHRQNGKLQTRCQGPAWMGLKASSCVRKVSTGIQCAPRIVYIN